MAFPLGPVPFTVILVLFVVLGTERLSTSAVNLTECIGSTLSTLSFLKIRSASISNVPDSVAIAENVSLPFGAEKVIFFVSASSAETGPSAVLNESGISVTPSGTVRAMVKLLSSL